MDDRGSCPFGATVRRLDVREHMPSQTRLRLIKINAPLESYHPIVLMNVDSFEQLAGIFWEYSVYFAAMCRTRSLEKRTHPAEGAIYQQTHAERRFLLISNTNVEACQQLAAFRFDVDSLFRRPYKR
jgi:hypothetical protein